MVAPRPAPAGLPRAGHGPYAAAVSPHADPPADPAADPEHDAPAAWHADAESAADAGDAPGEAAPADAAWGSARGAARHLPVLAEEVLGLLSPGAGETYVDATAGEGGHAAQVAVRLGGRGRIYLNDADPARLPFAAARVREACAADGGAGGPGLPPGPSGVEIHRLQGNFADLPSRLAAAGGRADMVLADLGFSSAQVDDPARGLSFRADGPLDMRLDPNGPVTAADLVNTLPEVELADVIYRYGEERLSRRIAQKLTAARRIEPIHTTGRLAEIVRAAAGPVRGPRHGARRPIDPATRTFQALRIAVNDELGALEALLRALAAEAARVNAGNAQVGGGWLRAGARVAIISFHSLEDRLVKHAFRDMFQAGTVRLLTRSPIEAGEAETASNPRARSAKLRAVQVGGTG